MKQRGYPLWLLRDVPAFAGFMLSFWTLVIVSITRAAKAVAGCSRTRDTISILLAHAEARLDYAFMRQAYRLCGLDPRAVKLHLIPPTTLWSDTQQRLNNYGLAFENMNRVVACHVEDLRAKYRISEREIASVRSCPLRLASRSISPTLRAREESNHAHRCLSSSGASRWGRWRALARDGGGSHRPRGPPQRIQISRSPTSQAHLRERIRMPKSKRPPFRTAFSNSGSQLPD